MKRFNTLVILAIILAVMVSACGSSEDKTPKLEQPEKVYKVGFVNPHPVMSIFFDEYRKQLEALGYVEGENVTYIEKGPPENLPEILLYPTQLVEANVDIMIVVATEGGILAKGATDEIPILFVAGDEPVEAGLVESLERPGGNITGVLATGPEARRLQLFTQIVPTIKNLYVPYNASDVQAQQSLRELEEAAEDLGINLLVENMQTTEEIAAAMDNIPAEADGIFILQDVLISTEMVEWGTTAAEKKLPLSAPGAAQSDAPSDGLPDAPLMGYGIYMPDVAQKAARLTDQILKGVSPGDIPVESAEFYLMVDLRVANYLGIEVPDEILEQADLIVR